MKQKQTIFCLAIILLGLGSVCAQEAITSSGRDATGSGGTASYSVGQLVYNTYTGSSGSVSQGMLQPYEISAVLGIENVEIELTFSAYPNPTQNYLSLSIGNYSVQNLSYMIYDTLGRLITRNNISETVTSIDMTRLDAAMYHLYIVKGNKSVKSFKIIKN